VRPRQARGAVAIAAALVVALVLAACGSSSSSSSSTSESSTSPETSPATISSGSGEAASIAYNGPEAKLPGTYPKPQGKPEAGFKVGFLNPNASVSSLLTIQQSAEKVVKEYGGSTIAEDAQFDVQTEVSQFNNLMAQHVDAVIVYPLDPKALAPSFAQAEAAGVPVIGIDQPADAEEPPTENLATSVLLGRDYAAYSIAKALAEEKPGATFGVLGNAAPVPALQYTSERQQYWGEKFGLEYLGRSDAQADTPAGAAAAMTGLLGKYPEVEAVISYNDPSAEAAASVASSSGKSGIRITGYNGEKSAFEQIEAGQLIGTFLLPVTEVGEQLGTAAVDLLTETGTPLPPLVNVRGEVVTKKNVQSAEGF
jgi:ribose transport system substrate-binding protein